MSELNIKRITYPDAANIPTEWAIVRASEFDSMRRDLDAYCGIAVEAARLTALVAQREAEIKRLHKLVISGFYEEEKPIIEQGMPHHELQDVVTAEEVQSYIDTVEKYARLNVELVEALKEAVDCVQANGAYSDDLLAALARARGEQS